VVSPERFFGILRHQAFELGLGLFVLEVSVPRSSKDPGEFRPGIGRAPVDDANRLDARLGRLDVKQAKGLPALDTAPELPLRRDDEVLLERVGIGHDFHPLCCSSVTDATVISSLDKSGWAH
jgi:hypothetical protein